MFSLSFGQTERPRGFLQWTVDREMGLKALIQTDPLSLLGCSKQQQGWTWSDGAVPAKHFGTCRDMKGSNETHFTIHWPHALSRQRFLPNIPAIYPVAQVCSKVHYQPTKPSLTIPSLLSLAAESAKSEAWPHNFKGTGGISNCGALRGLQEPPRDLQCMLIFPLVERVGSFIVKSLFFLIVRDCCSALAWSDPINISPQHQPL